MYPTSLENLLYFTWYMLHSLYAQGIVSHFHFCFWKVSFGGVMYEK